MRGRSFISTGGKNHLFRHQSDAQAELACFNDEKRGIFSRKSPGNNELHYIASTHSSLY